jgi:hypothetical protein
MHFQLSELSEDKFAESTEVEVDNMDEQERAGLQDRRNGEQVSDCQK